MERTNGGGMKISALRFDMSSMHDVSGEFTLPDYMPEVRRILCCTARVLPERKYPSAGGVELSGLVVYSVLYVGDDGALSNAPLNSEYAVNIPLKNDDGGLTEENVGADTTVESTSCRAVGPRRITISSRLMTRIFSSRLTDTEMTVAYEGGGECGCSAEANETNVKNSIFLFGGTTGGVSGEFREREGTRIISCDSAVFVESVNYSPSGIEVRGEAYLTLFEMTPEGEYRVVKTKSPINENVVINNQTAFGDDLIYKASATARPASVTVNGDDFGTFSWELEYDIDAELAVTGEGKVITDAYAVLCDSRTESERIPVLSLAASGMSGLTVSAVETVEGYEDRSFVKSSARVNYEKFEVREDGRIILLGNCIISAVAIGGGDAAVRDVSVPVRYETEARDVSSPSVRCTMSVLYTDIRLDGNRLNVSAELAVTYSVTDTAPVEAVKELIIEEDAGVTDEGNMILYYPDDDETLWSIGKKYRCPTCRIHETASGKAVMIY